jgi:hypothetical protein
MGKCLECNNEARTRGFCGSCYWKKWRSGELKIHKRKDTICEEEGCQEIGNSKGFCRRHYALHYYRGKKYGRTTKKIVWGTCVACGGTFPQTRIDRTTCNRYCYYVWKKRGDTDGGLKEKRRGEAMIILTKWRRGMIDDILVLRTINLYLEILGTAGEHSLSGDLEGIIKYCVREIKSCYGV